MLDWITKIQEAQAYFMNIQLGYDVKVRAAQRQHGGMADGDSFRWSHNDCSKRRRSGASRASTA